MAIHVYIAVGRVAIQMVTNATSVAETAGSVEVCAEITGVCCDRYSYIDWKYQSRYVQVRF